MNLPNTQYYTGSDLYSDGNIEDTILYKLKNGCKEEQILNEDVCFATYYHFNPMRRNLLSWYDFRSDSSILEIGAGLGAVTGLLAERVRKLTCIELSLKRSMINYYRNMSRENIDILVGNLEDMSFTERFDYITLIGVLEYCQTFNANQTYESWLRRINTLLNDSGTLIIAIENKFGLKYFAGAREDHVGKEFVGIEGYSHTDIQTFGKTEITEILRAAGFEKLQFYFPIPDYKFPNQIFSEDSPDFYTLLDNFDSETGYCFYQRTFSENSVMKGLIRENQFPFFANSFLIFAQRKA